MRDRRAESEIFRKKSTERVSGRKTLNDYIRVTAPSTWIVRIALTALVGEMLVFSTLGAREIHGDDSKVESIQSVASETNSDSQKTAASMSYTVFKNLPPVLKKLTFSKMTGPEIYNLVKSSDENWPVTSYDLITPENAKKTIVLYDNNGDLHFNLAWPPYGGFVPESIGSMGELSGTLDVSRDGGDGGHSMSYGRNEDGSYPNDSQRSVPKSSATVRTGILDVDRYLQVLDIVNNGENEESRISELGKLGYNSETASQFLKDNAEFPSRDEVSGPNNINDGALAAGNIVDGTYGYYGITAPWVAGDLKLEGGAGQLCTVFSWGTLCSSGLIHDTGTAEIH